MRSELAGDAVPAPLDRVAAIGRRARRRLSGLLPDADGGRVDRREPGDRRVADARAAGEPPDRPCAYGVRTVRESGGSVVVTIPPEGIETSDLEVGDDVVVWDCGQALALTERQTYLEEASE